MDAVKGEGVKGEGVKQEGTVLGEVEPGWITNPGLLKALEPRVLPGQRRSGDWWMSHPRFPSIHGW